MADSTWKKPKRGKAHLKAVAEGKLVETVNDLSTQDFMLKYAPQTLQDHVRVGNDSTNTLDPIILWTDGTNIGYSYLESCLNLVEETSSTDYQRSEIGWSPSKKRKEMMLPDMKYLLLLTSVSASGNDAADGVLGFVSFMITYEDGYEVTYIYEIHLSPTLQGKGHGRMLMAYVETIGCNVGVDKVMLTVFKSNTRAVAWYEKLGYTADEFSPVPRKLRNGTLKQPTYVILSKPLQKAAT